MFSSIDRKIKNRILNTIRNNSGNGELFQSLNNCFQELETLFFIDGLTEAKKVLSKYLEDNLICVDLECDCVYRRNNSCVFNCEPPAITYLGIEYLED